MSFDWSEYLIVAQELANQTRAPSYDDMVPNLPGLTMTTLLQSEQVIDLLKTL